MSCIPECGKHTQPFAFGTQPRLTHESGHPFAGDASSLIAQLSLQAWAAVSATMSVKLLSNFSVSWASSRLRSQGWRFR